MGKSWEGYVVSGALGLLGMYVYALFTRTHFVFLGDHIIRLHFLPLMLDKPLFSLFACLFAGMIVYGISVLYRK